MIEMITIGLEMDCTYPSENNAEHSVRNNHFKLSTKTKQQQPTIAAYIVYRICIRP